MVLGKLVMRHRNLLSRPCGCSVVAIELAFIKGSFVLFIVRLPKVIHKNYSRSSDNILKYYVNLHLRCIYFNLLIHISTNDIMMYKNRIIIHYTPKTMGFFLGLAILYQFIPDNIIFRYPIFRYNSTKFDFK